MEENQDFPQPQHETNDAEAPPQYAPSDWKFCGPENVQKILLGETLHDLRTMSKVDIERLIEAYPTFAAWFQKT